MKGMHNRVWWLSILVLLSLIWFWVNRKRYLLNLRIIYCADRQLLLKSGFAKGSFFKLQRPWDLIIFTSEYHFTSNISRGSAAGGIYRNYSRRWKATRSFIVCEFIHQLGKFLFNGRCLCDDVFYWNHFVNHHMTLWLLFHECQTS